MNRDYKPHSKKTSSGSPFLSGLMIGFLLGVVVTAGLTMYIKGDTSPFQNSKSKPSKIESLTDSVKAEQSGANTENKTPEDKLDFYTILPKIESTVTEKEIAQTNKTANIQTKKESYFLQMGSFKTKADADNLKAKLALQGFEAVVQTAIVPEQGAWHRVRVGPLKNIASIDKIRADLLANSFSADLIKVKTETK
ncbi:MAG: SPOR domain-containing protein [Methylophilaceae bacterium]|jgi:cell division protein FtsN